jgi:hypothetical protein
VHTRHQAPDTRHLHTVPLQPECSGVSLPSQPARTVGLKATEARPCIILPSVGLCNPSEVLFSEHGRMPTLVCPPGLSIHNPTQSRFVRLPLRLPLHHIRLSIEQAMEAREAEEEEKEEEEEGSQRVGRCVSAAFDAMLQPHSTNNVIL